MSGAEDGTIKIWHAMTYRLENTLNYAYERCWSIAAFKGTNNVAIGARTPRARTPARAPTPPSPSSPASPARSPLAAPSSARPGYDEGTIAVQLGNEDPIASMDAGGKVVLARHNEISTVDIKKLDADATPADGERLVLAAKELDVCEIYPQSLIHNSNGRFAVVTGDGEYIIYTALAWRKKSFGNALDFVWALSGEYAVRSAPPPVDAPSPLPRPPPSPPARRPSRPPPLPPPGAREPDVDQALPQL